MKWHLKPLESTPNSFFLKITLILSSLLHHVLTATSVKRRGYPVETRTRSSIIQYIIYFYFPILKDKVIIYVTYCFISINNRLLVVKYYSFSVVSVFSRNEFNSHILFNFCCCFNLFLFDVKIKGVSSLFCFYNYWF